MHTQGELSRQVRGQHIEDYIVEAQDNVRSAHQRSLEAAFAVWKQQLGNDQAKFESSKLMTLGVKSLGPP